MGDTSPRSELRASRNRGGQHPASVFSSEDGKGYRIYYLKNRTTPHQANLKNDYNRIQTIATERKKTAELTKWFEKHKQETFIKISPMFESCFTNLKN